MKIKIKETELQPEEYSYEVALANNGVYKHKENRKINYEHNFVCLDGRLFIIYPDGQVLICDKSVWKNTRFIKSNTIIELGN